MRHAALVALLLVAGSGAGCIERHTLSLRNDTDEPVHLDIRVTLGHEVVHEGAHDLAPRERTSVQMSTWREGTVRLNATTPDGRALDADVPVGVGSYHVSLVILPDRLDVAVLHGD